ncbi:sensor histidine kinase [Rathayibacter soli]|uniref:sensor histidine kinase n=1 Tax=Rathayibacter soli TaxID=3144168 RepID=UPI0027E4F2DF|nr:histidine kinase [Glaciibacter superstes]
MSWPRACTAIGWLITLTVIAFFAVPRIAAEPLVIAVVLGIALLSMVLATIVAWRVPRHPAGALLAGNGAATITVMAAGDVAGEAFAGDWMLFYVFLAELLLIMPTGRLARRGRRLWLTVAIGMPVIVVAFNALIAYSWLVGEEPAPLVAVLMTLSLAMVFAYFACLVASAVSLAVRYREADARGRLSLRWMFFSGAAVPLTLALCWVSYLVFAAPELVIFGLLVMHVVIPVTTTIALVRPRWFDIDAATVSAATISILSFGVLSVVSVVYAAAGLMLVTWSPIVGIVATLVVGVLAVPLYSTLRRVIARAVHPERERALTALRGLRIQMEAGQRPPEDVEDVLRTALRDPGLRVAYRRIGDGTSVPLSGGPSTWRSHSTAAVVRFLGEDIGSIQVSGDQPMPVSRAVCEATAPILDAVRLRSELRNAMRDVADSRERIMLAGYETRRRLERDLHDGAQQRLVSLGMRLRVLQRTVPGADALAESLDAAVAELATAVAELRQLAHGVRPSALDDGLTSALADLRRRAPHAIDLDIDVDDVPDAVATTAYFIASEAITNAIKHAQAQRIRIVAHHKHGNLHVTIIDDGRGGASGAVTSASKGLDGMHDRIAAHGGRLRVDSPIGGGTRIEAVIPCGS